MTTSPLDRAADSFAAELARYRTGRGLSKKQLAGLMGFDPQTGKTEFHYKWRAKMEESVRGSGSPASDPDAPTLLLSALLGVA